MKRAPRSRTGLERSAGIGAILLAVSWVTGCDRLGMGNKVVVDDGAPEEGQLQKISYMSSDNTGPNGRKVYRHLEEAKTCGDLELATRWNRPPNVEGGPFHKKLLYVTQELPSDLPKNTEIFIVARIEHGQMLPSGGAGWLLRMKKGPVVQAVEQTSFWEQQEQETQQGSAAAVVKPTKPGRRFCGHGVYQGAVGKVAGEEGPIPLVSMIFSMDREK